jgi:hypothetical protein
MPSVAEFWAWVGLATRSSAAAMVGKKSPSRDKAGGTPIKVLCMINISVSKLIDRSGEQAIGQGVGGVRHEEGQKHMLGAQECFHHL